MFTSPLTTYSPDAVEKRFALAHWCVVHGSIDDDVALAVRPAP